MKQINLTITVDDKFYNQIQGEEEANELLDQMRKADPRFADHLLDYPTDISNLELDYITFPGKGEGRVLGEIISAVIFQNRQTRLIKQKLQKHEDSKVGNTSA